ncbi:MAG: hypothetical protein KQJ78_08340 [Deltaproteobacteria bacterium]|nr:hypothetical protein [Deltaproteobacteria bacterium]
MAQKKPAFLPASLRALGLSCVLALGLASAGPAAAAAAEPLKALLDCFGYGYQVSVSLNGTPLPLIKGGGQQASRLFGANHPMKGQAPADHAYLFCLKEGENTITVEFQKTGAGERPLEVKLALPGRYDKPLFYLKITKIKAGQVKRKFIIADQEPAGFRTVTVTDQDL